MVDKVLKVFSSYHAITSLERSQTALNMDTIKRLFGVLLFVCLFICFVLKRIRCDYTNVSDKYLEKWLCAHVKM